MAVIKPRLLAKGLVLMVTLAALGWAVKETGLAQVMDLAWVDRSVKGQGLDGELLLFALGTIAMAVGVPRQAVCFGAGYAFGFAGGLALGMAATLAACVLSFGYARLLGRDLVLHRFEKKVRTVDAFLGRDPFLMTVLIRFLPVGSNLLTNLVAGVSAVRPLPFIAGSALGYLPQSAVFTLLGSGIHVDPTLRLSLSVALFLASALLGGYLYRKFRHGRSLGDEIDADLGPEDSGRQR